MVNRFCCLLFIFSSLIFGIRISYARTVNNYVIKQPGAAAPIADKRNLQNPNEPQIEVIDEQVLAQEQFARIKMLELEGREPYQENRKTTITRTY